MTDTDNELSTYPHLDLTAAERVSEGECQYRGCDAQADYRVEVGRNTTFLCCQECSRKNRIYAKENDLLDIEVTADE